MRKLTLEALAFWLAVGLSPGIADARGGFPAGARLHGFRAAPAAQSKDKAKAPVALEGRTNVTYVYVGVAGRTLNYPFLSSPRCPIQSETLRSCAAPDAPALDGSVR